MTTDIGRSSRRDKTAGESKPRTFASKSRRALGYLAILIAAIVLLFWPVAAYRQCITFDPAVFTTEWLKIAFSSVILFAGVELLLERNRAIAARTAAQNLLATEVTAPLNDALVSVNSARPAITPGATYDASDLCHKLRGIYERISVVLGRVSASDTMFLPGITHLATILHGYDWRRALHEFEGTTVWRSANVTEFERLIAHLEALYQRSCALHINTP